MHVDAKRCHGIGGPKFGIVWHRSAQGEFSGVFGWFTVFCQPTVPMVADPSALLNQKPAHF